jgi:hypothetical protein
MSRFTRVPQRSKMKNFFIILGVIVAIGGGAFAYTYIALESGYGACLFVRCVKVIN